MAKFDNNRVYIYRNKKGIIYATAQYDNLRYIFDQSS